MSVEDFGVAERLKEARKNCGLSIEQIAASSCVSQRYLHAIEANQFDKLPELTFAVGFVRAFAREVGEDCDELAQMFKDSLRSGAAVEETPPASSGFAKIAPKGMPSWVAPVGGMFGLALTTFFFSDLVAGTHSPADRQELETALAKPSESELAFSTQAQQLAEDTDTAAVPTPDDSAATSASPVMVADLAPASGKNTERTKTEITKAEVNNAEATEPEGRSLLPAAVASSPDFAFGAPSLTFRANADSWLRLGRIDGTELWSGVLASGESYSPPSEEGGLTLSLSDAGAVTVQIKGEPAQTLGARGQVIKDLVLKGDSAS